MFVYNILIMETPITDNKGKLILIPNPDLVNNWLKKFKETPLTFGTAGEVDACNGKDFEFLFWSDTKPTDSEIAIASSFRKLKELKTTYKKTIHQSYPLTSDECFKKEDWLNNKKHILVITLPSNFISILKILKTNKEQYFTLYKSKWSLKEKTFDAIVVDSSMPYHLEFYNSIKKYIKYKVPTYLLEKETLKTLK